MTRVVAAILAGVAVAAFFFVCIVLRVAYMLLLLCSEAGDAVNDDARMYEVETVLHGADQEES